MKRVFCTIIIILVVVLSGCNQQQKAQLQQIITQDVPPEASCTTDSYEKYTTALAQAQEIANDYFASAKSIRAAQDRLNSAIQNLKSATRGMYQIHYKFTPISNNSVGDNWQHQVLYNDRKIANDHIITAKLNSSDFVQVSIMELDQIPDRTLQTVGIKLKDGASGFAHISVTENRGRYSGNIAEWEFHYNVTLLRRI